MDVKKIFKVLEEKEIKIWQEKDLLKFKAPKGVIDNNIKKLLKDNKEELLKYLEENQSVSFVEDKEARHDRFPLTDIQSSYVLGRNEYLDFGGVGCHGYLEIEYPEILDIERLEIAWNKVIKKHDMLRAIISDTESQIIQKSVPYIFIECLDLRGNKNKCMKGKLRNELSNKQYKLGEWPMCHIGLSIEEEKSIIHFSLDMLIADFISMNIILKDLEEYYKNPMQEIKYPSKYRDVITYQKAIRENEDSQRKLAEAYWINKIPQMGNPPNLKVKEIKNLNSKKFYQKKIAFGKDKWEAFCDIAKKNGITTSALVLSALAEVISYWSGSDKFILNTTFFNRPNIVDDINDIVGDFTDVNITSINLNREKIYINRAKEIQENLWRDLQYKSFSGVEVLRKLTKERKYNVIVPVVFTSTIGISNKDNIISKRLIRYKISQTPQVYIDCQLAEENGGATINWDIREGVFDENIINDMFESFMEILELICLNSQKVLNEKNPINLPSESLKRRYEANNTSNEYQDKMLEEGFLQTLKNHPDKTALIIENKSYSYAQLGKYVNTVIQLLKAEGVNVRERIGINIEKSIWQIASVIAVLLCKGTYVPIEKSQPLVRKKKIIKEAKIRLLLSSDEELTSEDGLKNINIANIDLIEKDLELSFIDKDYERPAYIIFTSGTTGNPKGVIITHRAAMNTIQDVNSKYSIEESDVFLGLANLSFDLSVYDIFGCFSAGGTLVLPKSKNLKDPKYIYDLILLHRVTIWNSVPAQMQLIVNYLELNENIKRSKAIRRVMLSGDWIPVNLPKRIYKLFSSTMLISMGGATEASIWSIVYDIKKEEKFDNSVPYGKPLGNQKIYILNEHMQNCPDYVVGNIYISGVGLSTGYLNDDELNKQKYFTFKDTGERIYRTGDIGYYRNDGNVIFSGREEGDRQLKIRGHRIELDEIKSVLLQNPIIDSAVLFPNKTSKGETNINSVIVPKQRVKNETYIKDLKEVLLLETLEKNYEKNIDEELLSKWTRQSELVAIGDILNIFNKNNIFIEVNKKHSFNEIISKINVCEKYCKLMKRWLNVLIKEEIIHEENGQYYLIDEKVNFSMDKLWRDFYEIESKFKYSKDFLDYLKESSDYLQELIEGKKDPLDILFPKGDTRPALASYHDNKINQMNNTFITKDIVYLSKKNIEKNPERKFKILEVGAGVGGTTIDLIPQLDNLNVEYYFTDLSTFFLNKAKDNFGKYDWVKYGIFDINKPFEKQNFEAFSFDIILCANVLHNSKDIDYVMENLGNLLTESGRIIILEETKLSYMLLTSMEFKDGLTGFLDERRKNNETFFARTQWENILKRHDANLIYEFPKKDSKLDLSGQTVYIAKFKSKYNKLDKGDIKSYLRKSIAEYMIPSNIKVLPKLPLTDNKKVDEAYLQSLFNLKESDVVTESPKDYSPMTEIEKKMKKIWCRELNINNIGIDDDFYNIGGDSLLIAQVVGKIIEEIDEAKEWEWSSLLTEMMQAPNIRELSKKIEKRKDDKMKALDPSLVEIKISELKEEESIAKVLFHAGTGTLSAYTELMDCVKLDSEKNESVLGFSFGNEAEYISIKTEDTFKVLGKKYGEILKKLNYSKYILIGHCVGGLIALEAAAYLKKYSCEVVDVTLISTTIQRDKSKTIFKQLEEEKYEKALKTSLENELLLERTFSRLINANIFKAGHTISEEKLEQCIEYIIKEEDGNLSVESFINLDEKYKDVSNEFRVLSRMPISERLNKLYLSIERKDLNLLEHEKKMLNTLFNIFSQNFGCVATYKPKKYFGNVRVFSCEQEEESFYKEFFGENSESWHNYIEGNIVYDTVCGQHFDCLIGKNLKRNIDKILRFNY